MGFESQEAAERWAEAAEFRADQKREEALLQEKPRSHVYKRVRPQEPKPIQTVRDFVTKYGDDWRLMMQGQKNGFSWRDQMTFDEWEAVKMKNMETGFSPRVRHEDLHSRDD